VEIQEKARPLRERNIAPQRAKTTKGVLMKNVIKLLAITVLVTVIGFSFTACGDASGGGGGGGTKPTEQKEDGLKSTSIMIRM
jgi:hypothetical protein